MEWKDISSFSQGDKVRTPRTFEMRAGKLKICVTRHFHYAPTDWVLICDPWFSQTVISEGSAEEAQDAALVAVRHNLAEAMKLLTHNVQGQGDSRALSRSSPAP